ncbi:MULTISPECIES: gluconokinase [unclassified Oceanispirochaeta]|uniref:gluconokinase n=1 Tax=unclassified Oceanispirochaeta TaxID=2635722 RepID=UPI000E08EBFC|nr:MULTISPECIES: gluconokinase [unclassified Oceanispirochaeta]MBF9014028.1 gluconokinase [Oceanispirochaeta sp. M2]NPD70519.1 gluconokinase [Oceanispirochaeta sp. M1]RDG34287.1 gluconokinase [Oceanispirochaeta sp. M1]
MIAVIMGVSGCGKTTLGERCAEKLRIGYFEADGFHPGVNIKKMRSGVPLNDDDRWPWLQLIKDKIMACQTAGESAVFSCSALKESYRRFLQDGLSEPVNWVYLRGSFETIYERLESRQGHYQKSDMLQSQFEALEEPDYGIILEIDMPLDEKVKTLSDTLKKL